MLTSLRRRLFTPGFTLNPSVSLETSPFIEPVSRREIRAPRGTTLRDILTSRLSASGDLKYLNWFAHQWRSGKWNDKMQQDFWGPQYAQMGGNPFGPFSSVIPQSAVNMPDFKAFQAELDNINEVLRWGLYDRLDYAAAGQQTLTFFQQSLNAGYQRTNMLQPGALPGNQMQLVMGIRVGPEPVKADIVGTSGAAFADWYPVVIGLNWVDFTVATKTYVRESPIAKLAPGYGYVGTPGLTQGGAGLQVAPSLGQVGTPDRNAIWNLNIPIGILPTRTFNVTCNWIPVVTVTTLGHMVVELDGLMLRAAQ